MQQPPNIVSQMLRGALAKRAKGYRSNLVKIGCMEPPAPAKMAAAILKARKQNPKKKK